MPKDYNIRKTSGQCSLCDKRLDPGTEFTATVTEEFEELVRRDFCDDCRARLDDIDGGAVLCVWRTVVPQPEERKKLLVSDGLLVNLFERLGEADDPAKMKFRYVLALILMRKKLLIYDRMDKDDEDREVWSMHFRSADDADNNKHLVIDPKLTEDQIAEVSMNLSEIMEGDF